MCFRLSFLSSAGRPVNVFLAALIEVNTDKIIISIITINVFAVCMIGHSGRAIIFFCDCCIAFVNGNESMNPKTVPITLKNKPYIE